MPKEGDLKFNDRWHKYNVYRDGKWKSPPSVSKIKGQLDKPALMYWAAKVTAEYCVKEVMPLIESGDLKLTKADYKGLFKKAKGWFQEVSKQACDVGTEVHSAINRFTLTGAKPVGLTPEAEKSFGAYLKWEKEINLKKIVATELPFYSFEHDFCGTFDRLGYIYTDKLFILDYKTSKDFYDLDMAIQLAGYKLGVEELIKLGKIEGLPVSTAVDGIGILRLDKATGAPQFKDYTPWLPLATTMFVLLRDMLDLTAQFNKISGLTY